MPIPVIPNNETSISSTTNDVFEPDTTFGDGEYSSANQFASNDGIVGNENDSNSHNDVTSFASELTTTETVFLPENEDALVLEPNSSECDPIKEEPDFELNEDEEILFDDILDDIDSQFGSSQSADGEKSNDEPDGESEDEPILLEEDKNKKIPMPMAANLLGLMKRERDPISGSLAFNEKVNPYYKYFRNCKFKVDYYFRKTATVSMILVMF